jgi:formylglycine-generating enzyme required for sulfatase activity
MIIDRDRRTIRVFCPTHRIGFTVLEGPRIMCASEQHTLSQDFPHDAFWEYCCDCHTFWPSEIGKAHEGCLSCGAVLARRYLCDRCGIMSIESDASSVRKKFTISSEGGRPVVCPGCLSVSKLPLIEHECGEFSFSFKTASPTCPFCEEPIAPLPRFPVLAAEFLTRVSSRNRLVVGFDILEIENGFLVPSPDGEFLVIKNDSNKSTSMLLPKRTHFASHSDCDTISSFYDCDHPKVGDVCIINPAIVDAVAGGWALKERGRLQIVDKLSKKATQEPVESHKDAPVETNEPSVSRKEGRPSLDVLGDLATEEKPSTEGATSDPIRNSAKSFYQRLADGGCVTNDLIYLTYEKSDSRQGITNRDEFLREVKHALGDFVLFASSESRGWVFPNPGLVFRPDSLSKLFPSLTAEWFDSKQYIEPVPVVRVGKGRWKVGASQNGTPSAQPSKAPSKKGTKAETVKPAISTPASRNKLKPLLIGAVIFILCVGYLAIVMWNVVTGSGGNQIAKDESVISVEGGTFIMGRNAGDEYERPEHNVTVRSFYIDTYEVTRQDYEKFIAATNHRQPPDWANGHYPPGTARWPVTGVDWHDADAYARWAGKRLPTEEEWEYAARGTKGFRFPWGNEWRPGSANADGASQGLADVDKFKGTSPFGAIGMVGNAWEWTASRLTAYPGGRLPAKDHGDLRVIRGGSWQSDQTSATTTYRWGWPASDGNDYKSTGFRCAKDLSP